MLKTEFHMCLITELYGLKIENTNFYYVTSGSLRINFLRFFFLCMIYTTRATIHTK